LKMGFIRSGMTNLTPEDDDKMTGLLWPIVKEMIKTAIENNQNMIMEGCYIPYDWENDFEADYKKHIRYICLIMSSQYIETYFSDIKKYASVIERRLEDSYYTKELLQKENTICLENCKKYNCNYILIDDRYEVDFEL